MCDHVVAKQFSRGMSASDSAYVIRYGNTLSTSPRTASKICPPEPRNSHAAAILQLALLERLKIFKLHDSRFVRAPPNFGQNLRAKFRSGSKLRESRKPPRT